MKNLRWLNRMAVGFLATVTAIAGLSQTAAADEVRIATLAPRGSTWMKILDRGGAQIGKKTDNRITVKYYPNGVMGDERDVVRKMRLGQLDGAAVTSVGLSLIYEGIRVLEAPRLFDSVEELDYVRKKMWPYFRRKFKAKGFVLGSPGDVGWVHFYSSSPVKSLSDLRKAKVWAWQDDRIATAMFKALSVRGIPMGVPDVLPSLTSGRINAAYSSSLAAVALQWSSKVKYMTSMRMTYSVGASVFVADVFNKATDADRKQMRKILKKQSKKLRKAVRKDNKIATKQMTRKGVKVVETSPEMIRDFDNAAQKVWKQLVGKVYSQEELDMALKYRDEFRASKK